MGVGKINPRTLSPIWVGNHVEAEALTAGLYELANLTDVHG